jgi:hypothetical protein
MAVISLTKMEENYYQACYREWIPFPKELKNKALGMYGRGHPRIKGNYY